MNIVFVVTKIGRGGAQRVSVVLANYLKAKGHDVSVLYYDGNGTYELAEGIKTHRLPYSKFAPLKHIKRTVSFFKYCRKNKTDLVIALFRGYDYTYLYHKLTKTKLILSQRNDSKAEYDGHLYPRTEAKLFFSDADAVVFQTEEEMEYFGEKIRKKGLVIANPITDGLPKPHEGKRRRLIVNFCRLEPQKNLKMLIDAFFNVNLEEPEFKLEIYGNGSLRDELREYVIKKGLVGAAEIKPFTKDIHNVVKDAYMFVSSSDFEGISNSMLEAMGLGLACVCTDCPAGGTRYVIKDGENGLLTPTGDAKALEKAMLRLIREPELAESLGREAQNVRERFSAKNICKEWEKLINDIK